MQTSDGVVSIHGKEYLTVARRVHDFREKHPDYSITSKLISSDDNVIVRATIKDAHGRVLATGLAEEARGSTQINRTSALENAETSAVGRCLAFLGMGGTEIASADEVANAIANQSPDLLVEHNKVLRDCFLSVVGIKRHIENKEWDALAEVWEELSDDEKTALWIAPSKGGIFSTEERTALKCDEFNQSRKARKE